MSCLFAIIEYKICSLYDTDTLCHYVVIARIAYLLFPISSCVWTQMEYEWQHDSWGHLQSAVSSEKWNNPYQQHSCQEGNICWTFGEWNQSQIGEPNWNSIPWKDQFYHSSEYWFLYWYGASMVLLSNSVLTFLKYMTSRQRSMK